MKKYIGNIAILLCCHINVWSQSVVIPDTNLRKALIAQLPSFFDSNQLLIKTKAAGFGGAIDCSNKKITNLSGLEEFIALSQINCSKNEITSLDPVKNLTKLTLIDCHNNPLRRLPDLSGLNNLSYLWCSACQLDSVLDLSSNLMLSTLNCYDNQISEIKGLGQLSNLVNLNCWNNLLKTLPDLSSLQKLVQFQCFGNQLAGIPGLQNLVQLQSFIAGGNLLTSLPDLSKLTQLKTLRLWTNKFTTSPDVSKLNALVTYDISYNRLQSLPDFKNNPNLTDLSCDGNYLDSLPNLSHLHQLKSVKCSNNKLILAPDLSNSSSTLVELSISSNQIENLPDFSVFTSLKTLNVQNNFLSFDDLLPILKDTSVTQFNYSPQKTLGIDTVMTQKEGKVFSLKSKVDPGITNNIYTWFKDGKTISSFTKDSLVFSPISFGDSGIYTFTISNSLLPNLILKTRNSKLLIVPCLELKTLNVKIGEYECNKGAMILIDSSTFTDGEPPYLFSIKSNTSNTTAIKYGVIFEHMFDTHYTITVVDKTGCKGKKEIKLGVPSPEDCPGLVIAAEKGVVNPLNLEEKGVANVYNKSGKLVGSFPTPALWDGRLGQNEFIPGYYIVELNGQYFNVTLIK